MLWVSTCQLSLHAEQLQRTYIFTGLSATRTSLLGWGVTTTFTLHWLRYLQWLFVLWPRQVHWGMRDILNYLRGPFCTMWCNNAGRGSILYDFLCTRMRIVNVKWHGWVVAVILFCESVLMKCYTEGWIKNTCVCVDKASAAEQDHGADRSCDTWA